MAADQVTIYNLVLTGLGMRRLSATTDDVEVRRKLDAIYTDKLAELEEGGPEDGWDFCTERTVGVDVESSTISSFADYSATVSGTVLVTTSSNHNLISGNLAEIDSTTHYDNSYEITKVADTTFYITATWSGNDATGTVYWISDRDEYRFAIPTAAKRITHVRVNGIELTDWTTGNAYIYTGLENETIYTDYVKSITTTTLLPDYFTHLFVLDMQIELAPAIGKDNQFIERLMIKRDRAWYKALSGNQRKRYVQEKDTAWIDAGR